MTSIDSRPQYFHLLDGIRGLAALLVVLRHTGNYFGPIEFPISYLAVDVFFLLSGIVIAGSYEKKLYAGLVSTSFMKIRVARIYPLYILGSMITFLAVSCHFDVDITVLQAVSALPLAILLSPSTLNGFPLNGPAWSVFFELLINFIYGFFINFLTDLVLKLIVFASAVVLVAIVIMHPKHHLDVGFSFPYYAGFFRTTYSFFLGVLLFRKITINKNVKVSSSSKIVLPWLIIGTITLLLMASPSPVIRPYFVTALVLFVFPILIYISLWFQPSGFLALACKKLGIASYGIYALHVPLAGFISGFFVKILKLDVSQFAPWSGFIFLLLLFLICLLLDPFYDKPVRRFLLSTNQPSREIRTGI